MSNKTPELFSLLPLASCLLPLGLWEYVHNSNPNAITYVHQSTENRYSLSYYRNP
ncbi:MAG: hypothetical protein F6J99_35785 [Moorea sp. SIO4G3]|nr:hypothetical protein [Moorena sp. SIO4G3]